MKTAIKTLWLKELASGNYNWGQGFLEYEHPEQPGVICNCVFGVLTRLAIADGVQLEIEKSTRHNTFGALLFDGSFGGICQKVRDWAGINDREFFEVVPNIVYANDETDSYAAAIEEIEAEL
jgi:hypothetical protein